MGGLSGLTLVCFCSHILPENLTYRHDSGMLQSMTASRTIAPFIGRTIGDLFVMCEGPRKGHHATALCRCKCGFVWAVRPAELRSGSTKRCRACRRTTRTHGMCATAEYRIWSAMRMRCRPLPANKNHGARGIRVCKRWERFADFFVDMGPRPSPKHSLDRYPDKNGNYEPGNVRWALPAEQASNTRRNVIISYAGRRLIASEFIKLTGISRSVVLAWAKRGKSGEEIIRIDRERPYLRLLTHRKTTRTLRQWSIALGVTSTAIARHLAKGRSMSWVVKHFRQRVVG